MTFAHVSSIVLSLDLATNNVAEVVLSELTFAATLVINWGATKVIVRYSISHDSVLLVQDFLVVCFCECLAIRLLPEELVVLVSGGAVVHRRFKTHSEVGHSHSLGVAYHGLVFHCQFIWGECLAC